MVMGRKPAAVVSVDDRRVAAERSVRYRSHWGLNQEQMAVELGTHPSVIAGIERRSPFASTKFVAACLGLALATEPNDEHARRYRASRERQKAAEARSTSEAAERAARPAADDDEPAPVRVVDDVEFPLE